MTIQDDLTQLPEGLSPDDVRVALAETSLLGTWPAGEMFYEAEQPAAFAKLLREAFHRDLMGARIAHLFREKLGGEREKTAARAKKAGPELVHLADIDFLVLYSWTIWRAISLRQRIALVDHELSHLGFDQEAGWVTVPHDVEEFGCIARRWGQWHRGLAEFQEQLGLFEVPREVSAS